MCVCVWGGVGVCTIVRNADCWVLCQFYLCAVLVATPELETEFELFGRCESILSSGTGTGERTTERI